MGRINRSVIWVSVAASFGLSSASALAADQSGKPSELVFFLALAVVILVGRLLGELMQRVGQPAVMGQLLGGLLLGPSVFGALAPDWQHALFASSAAQKSMLDGVSQLGILMLLLLTGMETDLSLARRVGRAAASVSVAGIVLPFGCGFALGQYLPEGMLPHPEFRLVVSLFLGTALSISSVKIMAMVVREMNFMRRDLGQVLVASAVIDDTIGWIIIAITFSLASHGAVDLASLAKSVLGTALFLIVSFTIGRRAVFAAIRWSNDHLVSEMPVISVILVLMLGMALLTHVIGVHEVLGAFVCGILVGESPILTRQIDEQLRGLILGLFMPVFFALAGLSADLSILRNPTLLALTLGLIAIASIGKAAGAFIGGRIGGLSMRECVALACGMNARGSTEVIVASIGLSLGMLSQDLFTMIVTMAVATTLVMPPSLRWALSRLPMGDAERQRLEREAFEAKGFVANLERLLLAVDESANGRFAARLAGIIAGPRGLPMTVLQLGRETRRSVGNEEAASDVARAAAEAETSDGADVAAAEEESRHRTFEVTTRRSATEAKAAVVEEARRGYDLLLIGLDEPVGETGAFHARVARAAAGFEGPVAVLVARGQHLRRPADAGLDILVPVTGTEISRHAAEVAAVLARGSGRPMTAIHVARSTPDARDRRRASPTRSQQEVILKEAVKLAERYGAEAVTTVRIESAPEQAILREAQRGGHNLIVMGVNRRPGEVLFFGDVAAAVLKSTEASVLFVAK
jgi:Kef-type K+ transport system membrane component KefB/nucleotide-binding universal stress UspA family protein